MVFLLALLLLASANADPNPGPGRAAVDRWCQAMVNPGEILANRSLANQFLNTTVRYREVDFTRAIGIDRYIDEALGKNSSKYRVLDCNFDDQYLEQDGVALGMSQSTYQSIATNQTWIVDQFHAFVFDDEHKILQHDTHIEDKGKWWQLYLNYFPRDAARKINYVREVCKAHEKCGAYKVFASKDDCIDTYLNMPMGDEYSSWQNTVACRYEWMDIAVRKPATYCAVFVPSNNAYCNDANTYESFFSDNFFPLNFTDSMANTPCMRSIKKVFATYIHPEEVRGVNQSRAREYIADGVYLRQRDFAKLYGFEDYADVSLSQDNPNSILYDSYEPTHFIQKGNTVILTATAFQHTPALSYFYNTDRHSVVCDPHGKIIQHDTYTVDLGYFLRKHLGYVPENPLVAFGLVFGVCAAHEALCVGHEVYPSTSACQAALFALPTGDEYEFNQLDVSCQTFWTNMVFERPDKYCVAYKAENTAYCNTAHNYASHSAPFFPQKFTHPN